MACPAECPLRSCCTGEFELLSAPFGELAIESCRIEIDEEPSTLADLTGALTTVNAALEVDGTPISLIASGVVNAAGKSALLLAVSSMSVSAPSACDNARDVCERAARALTLSDAALTWQE